MTELMRILLDADTLLEFLLNRSKFIGKVEYLSEIFGANSSIQLYLSKPGLDKIVSLQALNEKESEQLVTRLKKRIKILRVTKAVAKKARSSSAIDYESAVEIHLAIKANIGAIVTHKPSDFSSEELSIITLRDLQQRKHLEDNLSKNIKDLPAVFVINSEQISNLDKAFYHLPSYTGIKSLEPKESSHQLDLTCSSDKVSSPSDDNSSPRSINARSMAQANIQNISDLVTAYQAYISPINSLQESIRQYSKAYSSVVDSLSIKFPTPQSIIKLESAKYNGLATTLQSFKNPLDESMKGILQAGKAYSSAIDSLSIKSSAFQSFAQLESTKFGGLTPSALKAFTNPLGGKLMKDLFPSGKGVSSLFDSSSIKFPISQSIAQLESAKYSGLATTLQSFKNPLDESMKGILQVGKAYSSAIDSLSIKSSAFRSFAQLESTKFGGLTPTALQAFVNPLGGKLMKDLFPSGKGLSSVFDSLSIKFPDLQSIAQLESARISGLTATVPQPYENSHNNLKASIDHSNKLNPLLKVDHSFSDRSGLLSQIKLLESMQRANPLDSYLSRKN